MVVLTAPQARQDILHPLRSPQEIEHPQVHYDAFWGEHLQAEWLGGYSLASLLQARLLQSILEYNKLLVSQLALADII